jgi:ABC-type multidrug transport system fused ATPase/permease subunit
LADRKIVVLDEPTSSLDLETESKIQKSIKKLFKGKTSIIVAHRLSTIKDVDRIIVLKKGKIVEEGTHAQLLKEKGEYKKLWEYQKHHSEE